MKKIVLVVLILTFTQVFFAQKVDRETSKSKTVSEKKIKEKLVGTWFLVSVAFLTADETRSEPYGENPGGILTFDKDGNYTLQILRQMRPKFVSNDKTKGTDEENKALVLGSNSHFGRYFINAADNTITFKVEHAFFPNWEGAEQVRPFKLTAKEFRYSVPATTNGVGVSGEVVWKRER